MLSLSRLLVGIRAATAEVIAAFLMVAGFVLMVLALAVAVFRGPIWLLLLLPAFASVVFSMIIEFLQAIESDLAAIRSHLDAGVLDEIATELSGVRTQLGRGVLGLLSGEKSPIS